MQMKILCSGRAHRWSVFTKSAFESADCVKRDQMGPVADENEPGACVLTQSCWHCISLGIITRVSIIVSGVIGFDVTDRPIGYLNCTESLAGHPREELIPKPNRLRFTLSWIERCVLRLVHTNSSTLDFLIERTDNNYFIPSKWCFESSNCVIMNLLYEAWEIVMINMCMSFNRKCDVCKFRAKKIDRLRVFRYF